MRFLRVIIAASVAVAAFYVVVAILKRKEYPTAYHLPENSPEETKFFREWYSRRGMLHIFCTDLRWLEGQERVAIVEVLSQKEGDLHLYLKELEHPVVKMLEASGANTYQIRSGIRSEHRLSIRIENGFHTMIIRNKRLEQNKIEFEEYRNHTALFNMAMDMIDDCYDRNSSE